MYKLYTYLHYLYCIMLCTTNAGKYIFLLWCRKNDQCYHWKIVTITEKWDALRGYQLSYVKSSTFVKPQMILKIVHWAHLWRKKVLQNNFSLAFRRLYYIFWFYFHIVMEGYNGPTPTRRFCNRVFATMSPINARLKMIVQLTHLSLEGLLKFEEGVYQRRILSKHQ